MVVAAYLVLNAVELEPGLHFQTGGADGGNALCSVELVHVYHVLLKVLLVDWGRGWGSRLLDLLLLFWLASLFGLFG